MDAAYGHMTLLNKAQPIDDILRQIDLNKTLRQQLITFQQARDFASQQLQLPDNDSYRAYSPLDREYVVWNVVATKEFSIEPEEWCFLLAGCFTYRGYFSKDKADAYAEQLKHQGQEVYVSGVSAYSTLGWFNDPVVSSMLYDDEAIRVGVMFHELAHQIMYRKNSTAFNESFAKVVEQEGVRRWFEYNNKNELLQKYQNDKKKRRQFHEMLLHTKNKLKIMYTQNLSITDKRQRKQQYLINLKQDYMKLKKLWQGHAGYDKWMSQDFNNAHFVLVQTYHDLVPMFKDLLKQKNNNLKDFYDEVIAISKLDDSDFEKTINQWSI